MNFGFSILDFRFRTKRKDAKAPSFPSRFTTKTRSHEAKASSQTNHPRGPVREDRDFSIAAPKAVPLLTQRATKPTSGSKYFVNSVSSWLNGMEFDLGSPRVGSVFKPIGGLNPEPFNHEDAKSRRDGIDPEPPGGLTTETRSHRAKPRTRTANPGRCYPQRRPDLSRAISGSIGFHRNQGLGM